MPLILSQLDGFVGTITMNHPEHRNALSDQMISEMFDAFEDMRERKARVIEILTNVHIPDPASAYNAYPHQISGGQRQRVMIAMALVLKPRLIIADEPTTALDVTVQAQIMELIAELQQEYDTAVILITHDLGIVADFADEVAVMYGARVVERGSIDDIFYAPEMPYTLGLLASVPRLNQVRSDRLDPIPGNPPSPIRLPAGCVFCPRCVYTERVPGDLCLTTRPDLLPAGAGHDVRCHLPHDERRMIADGVLSVLAGGTS